MNGSTYRMRLDLNVLSHLGFNLYSNVAAVLSEVVANSWDADSPTVSITINNVSGFIEIRDSGQGMSIADANERYLNVGYDKRKNEGSKSPGGRSLMGRKGIGKLSLFSIADSIKVASIKDGQLHGFLLSTSGVEAATKAGKDYLPAPLDAASLPSLEKGTLIRLEGLRRRATSSTESALRKRIARRFSVIGKEFQVTINGHPVSVTDRDDLSKVQFLWEIGEPGLPSSDTPRLIRRTSLSANVAVGSRTYTVRGWIGSAAKPRDLETVDSGNLNAVVILARGRLIQENILDRINIGGLFTKYLTGQIEADFLDFDDHPDIATSDRQRIIEDDERYQGLVIFMRDTLNKIESMWADWRAEIGTNEAIVLYPRIAGWIDSLPPRSRGHARRVIGSIQSLSIENEDRRRDLLRHGLMAFERMRLKESSDRLAAALETEAEELLPFILEQDQLEASLYLDIARGRLAIINQFANLVDENAKEKVLQKVLFDHLWLLDAGWERANGSQRMEERITKEFASIDASLDPEEKKGRIDIKYRTTAGKHLIIELKRYSVVPSAFDLAKQGSKYVTATRKLLAGTERHHEPVELICIVGTTTREPLEQTEKIFAAVPGRLVTYERLIQGALAAYGEYIEARRKVDAIEALLNPDDSADAVTPTQSSPAASR